MSFKGKTKSMSIRLQSFTLSSVNYFSTRCNVIILIFNSNQSQRFGSFGVSARHIAMPCQPQICFKGEKEEIELVLGSQKLWCTTNTLRSLKVCVFISIFLAAARSVFLFPSALPSENKWCGFWQFS